jgi:hypothetical protein
MPTDPIETILNRDLSRVAAKDVIALAGPLLDEAANYGTTVFRRCQASAGELLTRDVAPLMLYLHIVEFTDGIAELIRGCCNTPAMVLARSAFEASLQLEFMLKADYEVRCRRYLVAHLNREIESGERFDPATKPGAAFASASPLSSEQLAKLTSKAKLDIAELRALLSNADFTAQACEMNSAYKSRPFAPWFSWSGGPKNLRVLAERLDRADEYQSLYGTWSSVAHASSGSRFERAFTAMDPLERPIRNKRLLNIPPSFALAFFLSATRLLLAHFRPGDTPTEWYISEIRARYFALGLKEGAA